MSLLTVAASLLQANAYRPAELALETAAGSDSLVATTAWTAAAAAAAGPTPASSPEGQASEKGAARRVEQPAWPTTETLQDEAGIREKVGDVLGGLPREKWQQLVAFEQNLYPALSEIASGGTCSRTGAYANYGCALQKLDGSPACSCELPWLTKCYQANASEVLTRLQRNLVGESMFLARSMIAGKCHYRSAVFFWVPVMPFILTFLYFLVVFAWRPEEKRATRSSYEVFTSAGSFQTSARLSDGAGRLTFSSRGSQESVALRGVKHMACKDCQTYGWRCVNLHVGGRFAKNSKN